MEISTPTPLPCSCPCPGKEPNRTFSASETRLAAISQSRSLDMDLVTAEGDKVTLSYDAYAAAFYAEHSQVKAQGDNLSVEWTAFSAGQYSREVNLQVEGDLNAQEQREIRKVIRTLGRMLKKFVQGKVRPMMEKFEKLSGLETIASLEVDMTYARQEVVAQQTEMAMAYDRYGDVFSRPAQPLVLENEDLQTEASPSFVQPQVSVKQALHEEMAALVKEMAEAIKVAWAPQDKIQSSVEHMLEQQRKEMAQVDILVAELFGHIKDQLQTLFAADSATQAD